MHFIDTPCSIVSGGRQTGKHCTFTAANHLILHCHHPPTELECKTKTIALLGIHKSQQGRAKMDNIPVECGDTRTGARWGEGHRWCGAVSTTFVYSSWVVSKCSVSPFSSATNSMSPSSTLSQNHCVRWGEGRSSKQCREEIRGHCGVHASPCTDFRRT